jgi:uncharacterized membrane protein
MSSTSAGADAAMTLSSETERPIVSDDNLAMIVYGLYCSGYFIALPALIGVIIAHVKVDDTDPVVRSHYQFQIRTFWIGLLYLTVGTLLSIVLIGIPILIWWFVWSLIRIVKGMIRINEYKPIARPTSWLFG